MVSANCHSLVWSSVRGDSATRDSWMIWLRRTLAFWEGVQVVVVCLGGRRGLIISSRLRSGNWVSIRSWSFASRASSPACSSLSVNFRERWARSTPRR